MKCSVDHDKSIIEWGEGSWVRGVNTSARMFVARGSRILLLLSCRLAPWVGPALGGKVGAGNQGRGREQGLWQGIRGEQRGYVEAREEGLGQVIRGGQ